MGSPNAPHPPATTEGRADDRAGWLIEPHRNEHQRHDAGVCADGHAARSLHQHRVALSLRQVAQDLAALAEALDADDIKFDPGPFSDDEPEALDGEGGGS